MYKLIRVSLHNWYLLDALDIEIDGSTAIIGQTGAGKSSVLDAIQTALSGNNRNVIELNAAAGNARDRTVRDYVLGSVSDVNEGRPRRERCESTIVLVFHDAEKKHYVSIGVFLKGEKDQKEDTKRFVANNLDFRIADFIQTDGAREFVMSHAAMHGALIEACGKADYQIFPNSTKYVSHYLKLMRPENTPDARQFLRSFSNALQAKEILDPTDFVRRFVLEPLPLDVEGVKSSIAVWRELTEQVNRVEAMLNDISAVDDQFREAFRQQIGLNTARYIDLHDQRDELLQERGALASRLDAASRESEEVARDRDDTEAALEAAEATLSTLKTAQARDADSATLLVSAEMRLLKEQSAALAAAQRKFMTACTHLSSLSGVADKLAEGPRALVRRLSVATSLNDAADFRAAIESQIDLPALSDVIKAERNELLYQIREAENEFSRLDADTLPLAGRVGAVSHHVRHFVSALGQVKIPYKFLPEEVEVIDPEWMFALEALLGANREAILVPASQTRQAFDLLYRNRNSFDGVRLIDPAKVSRHEVRTPKNSIAEAIRSEDDTIRRFIASSVGRYVRVDDEAALSEVDFGITKEGKTSAGMTLRVFRDRQPVLGQSARIRAQEAAQERITMLRREIDAAKKRLAVLEAALAGIAFLIDYDLEEEFALLQKADIANRKLSELEVQLAKVAAGSATVSESEIEAQAQKVRLLKADAYRTRETFVRLSGEIATLTEKIISLDGRIASLRPAIEECSAFEERADIRELVNTYGLQNATILRWEASGSDTSAEFTHIKTDAQAAAQSMRRANTMVLNFCQKWEMASPFADTDGDAERAMWVQGRRRHYLSSELLGFKGRLERAQVEMETALQEGLISRLGEQFQMLDVQLDTLNERLARYTFVGQTYQFRKSLNPTLKPIYDLVRALTEEDGASLEEVRAARSKRFTQGLADIEILLGDDASASKELSDYRSYFRFELFIEAGEGEDRKSVPFSSVMGKLSGGQRQAPYYVAIAASMVSAYYPHSRAGDRNGVGLLVFDEAFNKLDIPNTQKLIHLMESLGLQVVVAAPEEKRSSLIECVDSIVSVSRNPGSARVFIDTATIGEMARQAMKRENPVYAS